MAGKQVVPYKVAVLYVGEARAVVHIQDTSVGVADCHGAANGLHPVGHFFRNLIIFVHVCMICKQAGT